MSKAIELANKIAVDFNKDWSSDIEQSGFHFVFQTILGLKQDLQTKNRIICFIIHSFDPASGWLDLNKDRYENKKKILSYLKADLSKKIYSDILDKKNEMVSIATFNFLQELKDWRWGAVYDFLDFSSRMFRFASEKTEDDKVKEKKNADGEKEQITQSLDLETIAKIEGQKGNLLKDAVQKRREADQLLAEIQKDFVITDHATQSDYGFKLSDTAKKKNILSWREFIDGDAKILKAKNHITQMYANATPID